MLGAIKVKVSPVRYRMDAQRLYGLWAGSWAARKKSSDKRSAEPPELLCSETFALLGMLCSVVWLGLVGVDVLGQP